MGESEGRRTRAGTSGDLAEAKPVDLYKEKEGKSLGFFAGSGKEGAKKKEEDRRLLFQVFLFVMCVPVGALCIRD